MLTTRGILLDKRCVAYHLSFDGSEIHSGSWELVNKTYQKLTVFGFGTVFGFAYRAVSLWNILDEDLRNAATVKALKKALKLEMNE